MKRNGKDFGDGTHEVEDTDQDEEIIDIDSDGEDGLGDEMEESEMEEGGDSNLISWIVALWAQIALWRDHFILNRTVK